ncbi:MAG: pyridoxamine 5'-phosphate oxidase family protein [Silicimonas sp.]|nr:pyridoxamine 5'-phosphate oxidase family protein [Silicimonas sp.]
MALAFADIAFTPAVRARQDRLGSGRYAAFLEEDRQGGDRLGEAERAFIEERDGFYQATVSETGWPYVQFRGGTPGFLRVIDDRTIAYADLRGNRQYLSTGNLDGNDRISLILMDYPNARRLKIWGHAVTHEGEGAEAPDGTPAERVVMIHVAAIDWNCPRHIPRRYTVEEAHDALARLQRENEVLKAETLALRRALPAGALPTH